MKNLNKFLLSLSLVVSSNVLVLQANAFDKFITVKFKNAPSVKFIKDLNKMTNTTVVKLEPPSTYILQLNGIANNDTLDHYSELFSIMPNVTDVSPVPKEKIDDKINPHFYMNNSIQDDTVNKNSDPGAVNNTQETQVIKEELKVTFNDNVPVDEITNLNNIVGGSSIYQKENNTYIVKVPDDIDPDEAVSFYENSGKVQNVEVTKQVITKTQAQTKQNSDKLSGSGNQSGVITSFPLLNSKEVKVTFKIGEEEDGMNWFNEIFGTKLVSKKGYSSYILRFPEFVNVKMVVRALKVCSSVSNVEVSTD